jgi:hypothetical protein
MNNATLPTADLATHVKIVAIAVVATIVAGLVAMGARMKSGNSDLLLQTIGHTRARKLKRFDWTTTSPRLRPAPGTGLFLSGRLRCSHAAFSGFMR